MSHMGSFQQSFHWDSSVGKGQAMGYRRYAGGKKHLDLQEVSHEKWPLESELARVFDLLHSAWSLRNTVCEVGEEHM